MENITEIYSKNLNMLLNVNCITQNKICEDLKIPNSTMYDYINARAFPRAKNLEKIADYFKVTVSSMLTY